MNTRLYCICREGCRTIKLATTPRKRGRPRDPLIQEALFTATAQLLGESGYAKLSIDAVAQRAGITRQTIYRRWPTKLRLVADLLQHVSASAPLPNLGNLRDDLLALYELYARNLLTPGGPIIPALVAESLHDAELAAIIDRYTDDRRASAIQIFERAIARGEMPAAYDPDVLIDLVSGFFWYRKLLRRTKIRGDQAGMFVTMLLHGLVTGTDPAATAPRD